MEPIVIYDKAKVIEKLIENGCDDYEGANEFYEFNQLGGWHGDKTPGFLIQVSD
jgi:biotin synthase-related radical SAM superfamily protein